MAPEQLAGDLLWAATDLYSLGVIYFEMLLGRTPFVGADCWRTSAPDSSAAPHPCDLDPALPHVCGEFGSAHPARRSWERAPRADVLLADLKEVLSQLAPAV